MRSRELVICSQQGTSADRHAENGRSPNNAFMGCYLRAYGDHFDVNSFAEATSLELSVVYRKGEPRNPVSQVLNETSGVVVRVSNADFHLFDQQLEDARGFLAQHQFEIRKLVSFQCVQGVYLDFGTGWLEDAAAQFWHFPSDFITALSELGLGLELSHYRFAER